MMAKRMMTTMTTTQQDSTQSSACLPSFNKLAMETEGRVSGGAADERINLAGMEYDEMEQVFEKHGIDRPKLRTKLLWHWMYTKGETNFENMHGVQKNVQEALKEQFKVDWGNIVDEKKSKDRTRKWLIDFNGQKIESVFIPKDYSESGTVCVSSQVGCK